MLKTGSAGHRYRSRGADPLTEAVSGISEEMGDLTWARSRTKIPVKDALISSH